MDWNNINRDRDTSGLGPIEYDQSKVPNLIRKHADNVRTKTYGQEVREAQARNAELAGLIAGEAEIKANNADLLSQDTQNRFEDQIAGTTNSDEVIDARRPFGAEESFATLGDRLDDMGLTTKAVPVNVLKLGMKNDGSDQTVLMQEIINNHERIDIPKGFYSFSNLIINSDTHIQAHPDAHINLTGQIKNEHSVQDDTTLVKLPITASAKRGAYKLNVAHNGTLVAGDIVEIYDGNWLDPTTWLSVSKTKGGDWWKKQFTEIVNVNGNVITLAEALEFDIDGSKNVSASKVNFNKDISIQGGNWNLNNELESLVFKYVNGLYVSLDRVKSSTSKSFINVSYSEKGSISDNKISFKSNAAIRLYYFTKNFTVDSNEIDVEDTYNGDGAIQLYSYATKNRVTNNTVKQRHTTGNFSDFMMGIVVHTSENNLIKGNTTQGFYYGLASYFGSKFNIFEDNETSYNVTSGIYVHQTWFTKFTDNIIHSNGLYDAGTGWINPQNAGITMHKQSDNIIVDGNNFHDNFDDIIFMENANNWVITNNQSNQAYGCFVRLKGAIKLELFNISENSYEARNDEVVKSFIRNYEGNVNYSSITNNTIVKGNVGIYLYGTSKHNVIKSNRLQDTLYYGMQFSSESTFNIVSDNSFINCVKAINATGQAKLNQYQSNTFINNLENYDFTDAFNFADDNQSLTFTLPVGFKIPSIEPNSGIEYMMRVRVSGTPSSDFIKQTRLSK